MKKLAVIIVNYNVCHFLEQALLSVRKASKNISCEIFVVDNNSADLSVEMVKNKFPEVILIENKNNPGFSKANNQAIRFSNSEYVLLLNPDTVIEEDTLEKCIQFMDSHQDAGGLGVKMLDGKGNFLPESKRGLPTPQVAFYKVFGLSALFPKSKTFGKYHLGYLDNDQTHEIEILSGAFMFMRKTTLDKVGLLDEEYFMYGEDIDLSYRIIKGGYKNYYFPETRIIHYKGESTKKTSVNYVFVFYKAMIIFAKQHFTQNNAGIFSLLINFAIYVRASIDILNRFIKRAYLPSIDFISIFLGMTYLKNYWEINHKHLPGMYPNIYTSIVIPIYISTWLACIFFSGGYDKPFKFNKVLRGVFIGTILISSVSNFLDEYRFSKALILMGAAYCAISFISVRILKQYILKGNFALNENIIKKIIIVGNKEEFERVYQILNQSKRPKQLLGFVSTKINENHELNLGHLEKLREIIDIYKANELIFCSKDLAATQIIDLMSTSAEQKIDFKIIPDDTNFIIGSNSKETQGDLYTVDVELQILNKSNKRNKRILDILLSIIFLLSFPLSIWLVENKKGFIKNSIQVLIGKLSWVGLLYTPKIKNKILKRGILSPIPNLEKEETIDEKTAKRLEILYAKDYKAINDLTIIFNSFKKLGNTISL